MGWTPRLRPIPPEEQQVIWLVQPSEQSYVRQENRLVHARYSLSPRELKLVLYACAMIDPHAEDFGKCYIRVKDYAKLTGTDSDHLYEELRDAAKAVRKAPLVLENYPERNAHGDVTPATITTSWFIEVIEASGDGHVGVVLSSRLKPFLLQVQRNFTRFHLGYSVRMKSSYSIRLYQLLQCWAFKGERTIPLDELRLCLGCREVDEDGNIVKDSLLPYKNFKRVALSPAVEEVNEKSDLSVSFREEKLPGSKSIGAIRFLIRRNVGTANKFAELPSSPLPAVELGQQAQWEAIAEEMGLSAKQAGTLADYVQKDGLAYVLEKAEIARKQPNPAAAFIKALREDWKKPAPKTSSKPKPMPKTPLAPPEPPPDKPDFGPIAQLWAEATESQRIVWLKDDLLRQTAPKNGEQPRPIFLARLYCLTQPAEGRA